MIINSLKLSLLSCLFVFNSYAQQASTWPFANGARGTVTGTPGEMRPTGGGVNVRFHNGVDLTSANGDREIYAVEGGNIAWNTFANHLDNDEEASWGSVITVGNYVYKHVRLLPNTFISGQNILAGTHIGTMFTVGIDVHVHMQRNDNLSYFNGLTPFTDLIAPQIRDFTMGAWANSTYNRHPNSHFAKFYRNGVTNDLSTTEFTNRVMLPLNNISSGHTVLYGRVDILSRARDSRVDPNGGDPQQGNNAPQSLDYTIVESRNNETHTINDEINFESLIADVDNFPATPQNPANWVFSNTSNCCAALDFVLTTDFHGPAVDRYWNTKLRRGPTEDWASNNLLNAAANDDTEYSDGKYEVKIMAQDFFNTTEVTEPVLIDNFMPYIKKVELFIAGTLIKSNQWILDSETGQIRYMENNGSPLPEGDWSGAPLTIVVTPSEPLTKSSVVATLTGPSGPLNMPQPTVNTANTQFTYMFLANFPTGTNQYEYCMSISGKDYNNNTLLALQNMPGYDAANKTNSLISPVSRNQNGTWAPTPVNGADQVHCFNLDGCQINGNFTAPIVAEARSPTTSLPPGQCLLADFTHSALYDGCALQFESTSLGDVAQVNWYFGDGATYGGAVANNPSVLSPMHTYQENGCYDVTLSIQDALGNSGAVTKTVCIEQCGLPPSSPECQVNGPSIAGAGAVITLGAVPIGAGPFTYTWTAPSSVTVGTPNGMTSTFALDPNLNNGTELDIELKITNAAGVENTCQHTVLVSGNAPSVELAIFGSRKVGEILVMAALADVFNLQHPEYYRFTVRQGTQTLINSGWLNGDYDYTICHSSGNPTCLPAGIYEFCVDVRDVTGVYTDCKTVNIGNYVPPPPTPPIQLINAENGSTTGTLEATPEHPAQIWFKEGNGYPFGNSNRDLSCQRPYYHVTLKKIDPEGNETYLVNNNLGSSVMTEVKINDQPCSSPLSIGYISTNNNQIALNIPHSVFGCQTGTWKIKWEFRPADDFIGCCAGYEASQPVYTDDISVDVKPSAPKIRDVVLEYPGNGCSPRLRLDAIGGCPAPPSSGICGEKRYKKYDWKVYDVETGAEISGLLTNNDDECVGIDRNHPFFTQFGAGEMARFKCAVTIWDNNNFTGKYGTLLLMEPPLRVNLPSEVIRCPGTTTPLSAYPIVVGNQGSYTLEWLNTGSVIDIVERGPEYPQVVIPASGGGPWTAQLRVTDANGCSITKSFVVKSQTIAVNVGPTQVYTCYTGPGLHNTIGPATVTGGTGNYQFVWSPDDHLRDAYIANPEVLFPQGVEHANFYLTVTDDYGCSATAGPVSVTGLYEFPFQSAGSDKTVCHRAEVAIGGQPSSPGLVYSWRSNNPDFKGSNQSQFMLGTEDARKPGVWKYTVRAVEPISGCYAEDEMNLTIRSPWLVKGYEGTTGAVPVGQEADLWQAGSHNIIQGHISPLTFAWLPEPPLSVEYNTGTSQPKNGKFKPTYEVPFLTLRATDGAGCVKEFKTKRYILTDWAADFDLFASPALACQDGKICFDVSLDAHVSNQAQNLSWMPPNIVVDYSLRGNYSPPPLPKNGQLFMTLKNNAGLYTARYCETFNTPSVNHPSHKFDISLAAPHRPFFGTLQGSIPIHISQGNPARYGNKSTCVVNVGGGPGIVATYLSLLLGETPCPDGTEMRDGGILAARDFIEISPDADIILVPSSSANGGGAGPHLLIDPCLKPPVTLLEKTPRDTVVEVVAETGAEDRSTPQTGQPLILEPSPVGIDLALRPNPFTGEIRVDYSLGGDKPVRATLRLLGVAGEALRTLFSEQNHAPGRHQFMLDGANLPAGVYWFELTTQDGLKTLKKAVKTTY